MNEIVNRFLLTGERFASEIHLRRPRLTYSVCGPFTFEKERTQKSKETGDLRYIYQNELRKYCFQHHTAYGDFKNLTRRRASHRI